MGAIALNIGLESFVRGCVHSTYARGMGGWVPKGRTLAYGMGGWVQSLRMYKAKRPEFFCFLNFGSFNWAS